MRNIIGLARTVDINDDGTCRVRLYDESGLPGGAVLTGVKWKESGDRREETEGIDGRSPASFLLTPDYCLLTPVSSPLTPNELDTAARQNLFYNSHHPVTIE